MFRPTLFATILAFSLAAPANSKLDADIIYEINPVILSNGFEISGGHITTDGSIGDDFGSASILDYEINITGTFDFTFSPSSRLARIFTVDQEIEVTDTEIFLPALPMGETAELRFEAREQLDPQAQFFNQQVFWSQGGNPIQRSVVGFGSVSFGEGRNQSAHGQGVNSQPMLDKFVIASTNSVPEPGGFIGLGALVIGLCLRRKR